MADVPGELGAHIEWLLDRSNEERGKGSYEQCILTLEEAWEALPDDKYSYSECFLIVWGILSASILTKDREKLNLWVDRIFIASLCRGDTGEREMWAGRVAYELGEFPKAKEYFTTANKKSRGRCFSIKGDEKYLMFLKKKTV